MDFDPALFAAANADSADRQQEPRAPVASPLPAISLPAAPRPSLSPAASRVFDRKQATDNPPRMNSGLDLSRPVSPRATSNDSRSQSGAANTNNDDDARDTASIRQNILNLVHNGQAHPSAGGGTTSLAQMMGASGQKRTHRVNTGMTEQEREETERLEREMAATRAKWAAKNPPSSNGGAQGPPTGGLSLASLLTGKTTTNRAATAPAVMEPSHDNDAAKSPAESAPTEPARRFAASPEPTTATAASQSEEPSAASSLPPPPPPDQPQSSTRKPHDTLTRLQSSNIVSDRLRWSEQIQNRADEPQQEGTPTTSVPPSPEKRRSVLERWGRDEPSADANAAGGGSAVPSSPTAVRTRPKSIFDAPAPSSQPFSALSEKPSDSDKKEDASAAAPKLQHITKDRARPTKSTARSGTAPANFDSPTPASLKTETAPVDDAPAPSRLESGMGTTQSEQQQQQGTKPAWQGAPIAAKATSKPPAEVQVDESSQQPAARHTRGVALPGMSASTAVPNAQATRTAPSPFAPAPTTETAKSAPTQAQATPPASPSKSSGAAAGVSSVRAAAMRWGQQADTAAEEERKATLAALKASYGVKVDSSNAPVRQATMPNPAPARQQQEESVVAPTQPQKSKSVDVASSRPASSAPLEMTPSASAKPESDKAPNNVRPDLRVSTGPSTLPAPRPSNDIVQLVLSQPEPYHLPPGETLSLDVFHLNSPTDDPNPIDHNHVLHATEILGIVHRAEDGETGGVSTHVWVWKGDEARETKRTDERIIRLEDKTGVEAVEVEYRHEPPALAEAFAGQLTICRGPRESFDHLARRMFSVQSHDGVIYVEEVPVASRSLCSGYSTTFSALGEVYAWLGEGSLEAERRACCEFAEAIADGRTVTVLPEGEETAMFWHHLPDDNEYASAQYWRRRPSCPERTTVIRVDAAGSSPFALVPEGSVPTDAVSIIDGGSAEHWVVVPESVKARKAEIKTALDAAQKLSEAWKQRGFASRTPYHLIAFPSLVPRDLAFLSRSFDLDALNRPKRPTKMHIFTAAEARSELL
ncbi:hypothetical protein JCM8115_005567 [Rhodotorula mucilaginosa]